MAKNTQVIAVSHLAQIAVMSDDEFLIEKHETDGKTVTNVHALDTNGKRMEIVRLLGGTNDAEIALQLADELLKQADNFKHSL